ncbi:nitronate monooxygenase [Nocardioides daedukensis]|uniref:Propionate 3-nitronate monooxygenase n=1 Tax=Nocardioides daedukensis TaxID=634462 RepID=A0A7Y9S0A5_9ACTN|nr:nitronate monooxygenase [Nocardioides daedukensis]NYG57384.1 nitronate monooxygenase [Nocardioides daedukensis]
MSFLDRPSPVVCAPMAGASTPELAAAVSSHGGLGFLAAGYLSVSAMASEVAAYRTLTTAPVAINLFTPQVDRTLEFAPSLAGYRAALEPVAARLGATPGQPTYDTDAFEEKVAWLVAHPVDAVSLTFGPVPVESVVALQQVGTKVGFTVTSADEAQRAAGLGADFLVAQGCGAGGHRGTWNVADVPNELVTAEVVTATATATGLPVIAAGGVGSAEDVSDLLAAGALSVAVGTLFLACEESKASTLHKAALTSGRFPEATVTRAFSGRWARALVNDFVREYDGLAPSAYPNVHHLTKPLRAAAADAGDVEGLALWAGAARPRGATSVEAVFGGLGQ